MLLVKTFEAGYNRKGIIAIKDGICHVCEQGKPVLTIDTSENEYGDGMICLDCIQTSFKEYKVICKKRGLKRAEAIDSSFNEYQRMFREGE